MTRLKAGLLAMLACACTPAGDNPPPAKQETPVAAKATSGPSQDGPVLEDLVGEYRLAGIDGQEFDSTVGIAVSIGPDMLSYEPRCLGYVWRYRLAAGQLTLTRDPRFGPQTGEDGQSVVCLPAVSPEMTRLAAAFDAVTTVRRTPANGIEFSGGGHSVLLFSQ